LEVAVTVPKDVLRFEALLYLSLILDCLTVAFLGASGETAETRASLSTVNAFLIMGFFTLVWLAAQRRKNWARWALFGFFVFTAILYIGTIGERPFGISTIVDWLSLALSALGFYYAFTAEAQQWFKPQHT
jgi:hypothetical protein